MQLASLRSIPRTTSGWMLVWVVLALLLALPIVQSQSELDGFRARQTADESMKFLPSGKALSTAVLGYDNLAADLLWVRGIALFGERYKATRDEGWYKWLFLLIDLASDLDPLDHRIYKYGGLMLRLDDRHIDQSTYIFNKGLQKLPSMYFLPYGIAMNYFEAKKDTVKAAEYMRLASTRPDAPFYLRNLAATMLDESRREETALSFLEDELPQLKPGSLPYKAVEVKILEVKHDIGADALQRALTDYLSIYDRLPPKLEAMKGLTWKGPWPEDPYGGRFILDTNTGKIESDVRELARQRISRETGLGLDRTKEKPSGVVHTTR